MLFILSLNDFVKEFETAKQAKNARFVVYYGKDDSVPAVLFQQISSMNGVEMIQNDNTQDPFSFGFFVGTTACEKKREVDERVVVIREGDKWEFNGVEFWNGLGTAMRGEESSPQKKTAKTATRKRTLTKKKAPEPSGNFSDIVLDEIEFKEETVPVRRTRKKAVSKDIDNKLKDYGVQEKYLPTVKEALSECTEIMGFELLLRTKFAASEYSIEDAKEIFETLKDNFDSLKKEV